MYPWRRILIPTDFSTASEWSETLNGPKPTVWWNFEPGAGQSGSASRITFEPTTQYP